MLCGLAAIGEDLAQPYIQKALIWLKSKQNSDGGWGESCASYHDPALAGIGASTPSQTGWALLALLAAGELTSASVQRGIDYLLATQKEDGSWDEEQFTGTGFPKYFMIRYHIYRNCFPLSALGTYRRLLPGISNESTGNRRYRLSRGAYRPGTPQGRGCCPGPCQQRRSDRRNLAGLDVEISRRRSAGQRVADCRGQRVRHPLPCGCRLPPLGKRARPRCMPPMSTARATSLQAALAAGLEKVVYTSSVGTLGNPGDGTPGDEETPVSFSDMTGDYKKSKFLAEREAEGFVRRGLPLVIVNPSTPVGPLDIKPTPTGKIIVDFLAGRMPAYLDTGLNIVCRCGVRPGAYPGRQRKVASARNTSSAAKILNLAQIFAMLAEISGRPAPRWRLPYGPVLLPPG